MGDGGTAGEPNADSGAAGTVMVPEAMPGAPTVLSVSPADESSAADPAKPVVLRFSEPLDPASVSAASVQVKTSAGSPVPGTVSYKDAVATFTPTARFNLLATYTVNVTTAVKDVDGTALAAPFTSLFVVRDGSFGTEADLAPGADATTLNNFGARFASGDSSAIVVWSQKPAAGTSYNVVARLYNEASGWGDPTVLNTNTTTDATAPVVAMNAQGDAVVAWAQADANIGQAIVARRLVAGMWEGAAPAIDHAVFTMNIHGITAGISPLGTAHVIWTALTPTTNPPTYFTLAQDRQLAGDWAVGPDTMQSGTIQMGPTVMAFDTADNGYALYAPIGGSATVHAQHYLKAGTWSETDVMGSAADNVDNISLAVDGTDSAMAVWSRDNGSTSEVVASRYQKLWAAPVVISGTDTSSVYDTSLAHGAQGFVAVWSQGGTQLNVKASEFGTAWSTPLVLSSGAHSAQGAFVAADPRGNALLLWSELAGGVGSGGDIWFSRLNKTTDKWSNAALVETTAGNFDIPHVGVLADGSAVSQWELATAPGISGKFVKGFYGNLFQ
jgi:hypothetical protein